MDQIEAARKAHSSVSNYQQGLRFDLNSSPIILNKPRHQILHPVGSASNTRGIPGRLWQEWGDHNLLMQELELGWIPGGKWYQIPFFQHHADIEGRSPTYINALEVAKSRGYYVPEEYLAPNNHISYSEFLAYRAAHDLILNHSHDLGYNILSAGWKEKLMFFTGQFIVPDPLNKNKTPYIIDQLWVIRTSTTQVRLIGLEIDGEHHFQSEDNISRDRERDVKLAAMGYEIYHVAGWWCRIDPIRVIHEFLQSVGIFPNAVSKLKGSNWQSIDEYKCGICHQPIVRHEDYWFEKIKYRNDIIISHPFCAADY